MTKILVIRFRRIGDAVLSSAICSSLKQSIPDCEVHYVLNEGIAPLFEHHAGIDRLITFSEEEMQHTWRYLSKIRKLMKQERYDIIIDTRATVKTLGFSLFGWRARYRIGYRKAYSLLIHNHRIRRIHGTDEVTRALSLLDPLEKEYPIRKDWRFRLYCTPDEHSRFRRYMESRGVDFSRPVLLCAVSARLEHKIWPFPYMQRVLRQVLDKYDVQLVFNHGGNREKEQAIELHRLLDNDKSIFTEVEAHGLRELSALMANCSFLFGNEGGPRHISQAFEIPSLAIFPPETPMSNWLPNRSERFRGIELKECDPKAAGDEGLTFQEKFARITPEIVWPELDTMLSACFPESIRTSGDRIPAEKAPKEEKIHGEDF